VAKLHGEEKAATVAGLEDLLRNHADGIASMDLFVVPTAIVSAVVWISWLAAFPPQASVVGRDRHAEAIGLPVNRTGSHGLAHTRRTIYRCAIAIASMARCHPNGLRAMGVEGRLISPRSPWTKRILGEAPRLDRRDCLDMLWLAKASPHLLQFYQKYYNEGRTLSMEQGRANHAYSSDRRRVWRCQFCGDSPPLFRA